MLAAQLQDADRVLAGMHEQIENQQAAVADLERNGGAATEARAVLARLLKAQALHREHRDQLADELKT